jgi:hypothetical protein
VKDGPLGEPDGRLAEILISDWANGTAPRLTFDTHAECPCPDCAAATRASRLIEAIFG